LERFPSLTKYMRKTICKMEKERFVLVHSFGGFGLVVAGSCGSTAHQGESVWKRRHDHLRVAEKKNERQEGI
jgi:hypothetical protein